MKGALAGGLLLRAAGWPAAAQPAPAAAAPAGAAAGYQPDAACAPGHAGLFASYQKVGMAKSLASPEKAAPLEDFAAAPYFHAPSGRWYQMVRASPASAGQASASPASAGITFRRWRLDEAGRRRDELELPVAWVLGSGHTSRVYLYATPSGELFQLPLAWYSQENAWAMAPGYDRADHEEVSRRIRRECLFCHNAYPAGEPANSRWNALPSFPQRLPEGIGCQRCHGPGAAHVELVTSGEGRREEIAKSIVNPARLPRERRREVCYQCHLQPSVSLIGVRRFGRDDYSFRPGERLADYLVAVDPLEAGQARSERFEINHHPYRLEQSACFRQSAGELSCLSCHDPHRKVAAARRVEHYRRACLACHGEAAACRRGPQWAGDARAAAEDCAGCHMPRRRTQDVVHVAMTDHKIGRQPGGAELLAPRAEREPEIEDLAIHPLEGAPAGRLGEIYRALAVLRVVRSEDALAYLAKALPLENPPQPDPWLDLAGALLRRQRMQEALAGLDRFGQSSDLALQWRAIAEAVLGRGKDAEATLRRAAALAPRNPELAYNLGRLLRDRDPVEAETWLARAAELRPIMAPAWYQLGLARAAQGKNEAAGDAWRQALAFDPGHGDSRAALARSAGGPRKP